jgi:hypothetical protein
LAGDGADLGSQQGYVRVDQALEGVARPAQLAGEGWLEFGLVATGRRRRRRL